MSDKAWRKLENVWSIYKHVKHNTHTLFAKQNSSRLNLAFEQPFCVPAFQRGPYTVTVPKSQVSPCHWPLNLSCNFSTFLIKLSSENTHTWYIRNPRPLCRYIDIKSRFMCFFCPHQKSCCYSQRFSQTHITIFSNVEAASWTLKKQTHTRQLAVKYPFQAPL